MELSSLFEIINQYGWWSIAIAACLGLIYILVKLVANKITGGVRDGMNDIATKLTSTVSNQLQELSSSTSSQVEMLSNNIAKQNTALVKAISNQNEKLLSYIMNKEKVSEDLHGKQLETRMGLSESIINKLRDIMHSTHSQRVFIIEFHNSYKNLAGAPFAKYTCTYEWFDKGLDQISTKIVGLPYSTMARIVGDVKRTGKHQKLYTDMQTMEAENPQLFSLVKDSRTTAIFYNTLYDEDNVMMGMLVIEWQLNPFPFDAFNDARMDKEIAQESIQLSTWLSLQGPSIEEINEE